jgi:hypothetical protein
MNVLLRVSRHPLDPQVPAQDCDSRVVLHNRKKSAQITIPTVLRESNLHEA